MASICVASQSLGTLAACAEEPEGSRPSVLVSGCLQDRAMLWRLTPEDALVFGRGLVAVASQLIHAVEMLELRPGDEPP